MQNLTLCTKQKSIIFTNQQHSDTNYQHWIPYNNNWTLHKGLLEFKSTRSPCIILCEHELARVRVGSGTSWCGHELVRVRVGTGTSWHGYELTKMGTSRSEYESVWVRVDLFPVVLVVVALVLVGKIVQQKTM